MAISFTSIGANSAAAVTTLTVTTSGTITGNTLVVNLKFGSVVSGITVQDNHGTSFTANPVNTTNTFQYYLVNAASNTSVTISWTGSSSLVAHVLGYSGVSGVGAHGIATGTSTTPSIAVTTTANFSFIVAALADTTANIFTANTGNIRFQGSPTTGATEASVDNTAASSGTSVTCSVTTASTAWSAVAIELLATIQAVVSPSLMQFGVGR